jgi:hypothetical protein
LEFADKRQRKSFGDKNMTTTKTFTAIVERDPESGWLSGTARLLYPGSRPARVGSQPARGNRRVFANQKIIMIPDHGSMMIFRPLLRKILRDMGIGIEEYEKILKEL